MENSRVQTLCFRRRHFGLSRELETSLEGKGALESGKPVRIVSSKHPPSTLRKVSRCIRGPVWLSREVMTELQSKQEVETGTGYQGET